MAERLLALTFDRSWTARKIFAGELRHTMPARTPRDSSRAAASMTSVMIAPAPTSVTSSSAAGRADSR